MSMQFSTDLARLIEKEIKNGVVVSVNANGLYNRECEVKVRIENEYNKDETKYAYLKIVDYRVEIDRTTKKN